MPLDQVKPFRFTRENAREFSARGNASRWARWREQRALDLAKPPLIPPPPPEPDFAAHRLADVRAQLRRLDRLIAKETDPLNLDRLARAALQLSNQEFDLAGRPRPGQRRPGPEPSSIPTTQVSRAPRPAAPPPTPPRAAAPRPSPVNLEALEQAPLD